MTRILQTLRRLTGVDRREQRRLARLIEESASRCREGSVEIPAQRDERMSA